MPFQNIIHTRSKAFRYSSRRSATDSWTRFRMARLITCLMAGAPAANHGRSTIPVNWISLIISSKSGRNSKNPICCCAIDDVLERTIDMDSRFTNCRIPESHICTSPAVKLDYRNSNWIIVIQYNNYIVSFDNEKLHFRGFSAPTKHPL